MADINKSYYTGRIGTDIELKSTPSGISTCSFPLAVERPKAKDAEKAEADWLTMVAWRSTAEFCARYLTKGRKVVVECTTRTRSWEDKDGNKRKAVEFQILNIVPADAKPAGAQQQTGAAGQTYAPAADFEEVTDDGDLPF